jgi:transmembrane sensor
MEDKSLQEYIQELIEDDKFIKWVKSDFTFEGQYWSNYIDANLDKSDQINEAIKWVNRLDFKTSHDIDTVQLWSRIKNDLEIGQVRQIQPKQTSSSKIRYFVGAIAAACLGLLFFYLPSLKNTKEINTQIAQEVSETLPDGSSVRLNALSTISYSPQSWEKDRTIFLEGEAYFEVKKGSKFVVKTSKGEVEVLGTSFNIDSHGKDFSAVCTSGKVKVTNTVNNTFVELIPGTNAFLNEKKELERAFDTNETSWLNGLYRFENKPMNIVIEELERQFDIKVLMDHEISELAYSGFFYKKDLIKALESITWPMNLSYDINGKNVSLKRK